MWMDQTKPECLYPTSFDSIVLFMVVTGFNSLFWGDLHFKNKFWNELWVEQSRKFFNRFQVERSDWTQNYETFYQ